MRLLIILNLLPRRRQIRYLEWWGWKRVLGTLRRLMGLMLRCIMDKYLLCWDIMGQANLPLLECSRGCFHPVRGRFKSLIKTYFSKWMMLGKLWGYVHNMMFYLIFWHQKNILMYLLTLKVWIRNLKKLKLIKLLMILIWQQKKTQEHKNCQVEIEENLVSLLH